MQSFIRWLNQNNGALTAMAALVGVLLTAVYAVFTLLLWRAMKAQADITRRIFEASHRPYVTAQAAEPADTGLQGRLTFNVNLENQGTVPADITAWHVWGTLMELGGRERAVNQMEPIQTPVGTTLSPHGSGIIELEFVGTGLPNPSLPFRLRGRVEYQGLAPWTYRTDFEAERLGASWKMQSRAMK